MTVNRRGIPIKNPFRLLNLNGYSGFIRKIDLYITKTFLIRFLQILASFCLVIFFINFLDTTDKVRGRDVAFYLVILMSFLRVPDLLNDIVPSLVLISSIVTFFTLSSRSEITIIRVSGFLLWKVIRPVAISAFLLGVFWIFVFEPMSIFMTKTFHRMEAKYVDHESREVVALTNGIWLKQENTEIPNEEILIQAKKVYKENLELNGVTLWFFNENGQFYKKIDANKMWLKDGFWLVEGAMINEVNAINKVVGNVLIKTNLDQGLVIQKVVNDFQSVKLFSIFELPDLIKDMRSSGIESTKFSVYFHSLLIMPFLFLAMVFISCYFSLNHIRNNNAVIKLFLGMVVGLALYIINTLMNALGSSGLISVFASTWMIAIICVCIGVLLIYRKESF